MTGQLDMDAAIEAAGVAAPDDWWVAARTAVLQLAAEHDTFTADDVWGLVGQPPEPRALGAVVREAQRDGLIVSTARYLRSTRRECHRRPVAVWAGTDLARLKWARTRGGAR